MNDVKRKLLEEIDAKIKKREAIRKRTAQESVETFVLEFIKNIEDINEMRLDEYGWKDLAAHAEHALSEKIRTIDSYSGVLVDYVSRESGIDVNKVTIGWSSLHQAKTNCDPELSIDIMALLFK